MDFYEQKKKQQNVFGNGAGNPNEQDVSFDFDQHLDQLKYAKTVEDIEVQIDMMNRQAEVDQEEKEEQRAKMIENRRRYKKELKEHQKAKKREKQQQILQAEKERTAERLEAIRAKTGTAAVRITKKTSLGFYVEKETLPLYVFHLSDISVKKTKGDFGRLRLSDLKPVQWEDFVEETDYSDFFVTEIEDYEKDLSIFLVDDDRKIQAGALFALRGDVLFVEGIFAYGSDEESLLNDLIYWGTEGAKKHLSPDKQVDIFLPGGKTYRDILMEVTDKKAKRVGNLMTYTCQVPI